MKLAEWELLREETVAELARLREEMEAKLAACEARLLARLEEARQAIEAESDDAPVDMLHLEAVEGREKEETRGDSEAPPEAVEKEPTPSSAGLDTLINLLDAGDEDSKEEEVGGREDGGRAVAATDDPPADIAAAESSLTTEEQTSNDDPSPPEAEVQEDTMSGTEDDEMPPLEQPHSLEPAPAEEKVEVRNTTDAETSQAPQPLLRSRKPPARPPRQPKEGERERPASMWIPAGNNQQLSAPVISRSAEARDKRRSAAFSLANKREAPGPPPPGGVSPLRHLRSSLLTAGRTQSIPNLHVGEQKQKERLAEQSTAADVEEALKVVAAAVFKGLLEVESSLEAQPPKKLKGFVNGRALASFLVRVLRLRSRNEALKLLNAIAARYIMDATCQADCTPIIMDEAAEWFGFKIPVFMFPEKLTNQVSRAAETVLGHSKFGPCDISRIVSDVADTAAQEAVPVAPELLRGPVETSGEKAKKWHKRFAVLTKYSLKLFRSSDMSELIGEHVIKSLTSLVFTPAKSGGRDAPKASQFTLCFVVGENRTAFSVKVPSDSPHSNDEWILAIDGAQAFDCALISLLDATALSHRSRMALLTLPPTGTDEITHGKDTWTVDMATGKVRCITAELGDITYVFDGCCFYPPADANQLHGMGRWDGLNLCWFETASFDDRNAVKAAPLRGFFVDADPVLRYHFDKAQHLFVPAAIQEKILRESETDEKKDVDGGGNWCWTGEDLARKDGTGTAWSVHGTCPHVIVMLLQMLWDYATQDVSMPRRQLVATTIVVTEDESCSAVSTPEREDSPEPESEPGAEKGDSAAAEDPSEAVELRPVPMESSSIIAAPYSSMNAQQSRSKTSTKVKRSRRRSVKLTKKLSRSDSPKPGDSVTVIPDQDNADGFSEFLHQSETNS